MEWDVTFDEARGVAIVTTRGVFGVLDHARIGPARSAILVKSLVDFGRGRQFELVAEGAISAPVAVFLDEDAAWRWLGSDAAA